jgi:HEAT repeat protein
VTALIAALEDDDARVRSSSALGLGELGQERAAEALITALGDGNSEVRQHAAVALGTLGSEAGFPALVEALTGGPADLRFQAATSIVEIDADKSLAPLLAALRSEEDEHVLGAIALSLGAVGAETARDPLAAMLTHPGPNAVFDAAYALSQLGDQRAVEALRPYADSAEFGWDSVTALEELASPEAADVLATTALRANKPPTLPVRAAAALLRIAPEHDDAALARSTLTRALANRKVDVRGLAIQLMGELAQPWAKAPLEQLSRKWTARRHRDDIEQALAKLEDSV